MCLLSPLAVGHPAPVHIGTLTIQQKHPPNSAHVHVLLEGVRGEIVRNRIQHCVETRHHQAVAVCSTHGAGYIFFIQREDGQDGMIREEAEQENEEAGGNHPLDFPAVH